MHIYLKIIPFPFHINKSFSFFQIYLFTLSITMFNHYLNFLVSPILKMLNYIDIKKHIKGITAAVVTSILMDFYHYKKH